MLGLLSSQSGGPRANAVVVGIADAGAGSRRAGAVAVGVEVIYGGIVARRHRHRRVGWYCLGPVVVTVRHRRRYRRCRHRRCRCRR